MSGAAEFFDDSDIAAEEAELAAEEAELAAEEAELAVEETPDLVFGEYSYGIAHCRSRSGSPVSFLIQTTLFHPLLRSSYPTSGVDRMTRSGAWSRAALTIPGTQTFTWELFSYSRVPCTLSSLNAL